MGTSSNVPHSWQRYNNVLGRVFLLTAITPVKVLEYVLNGPTSLTLL